MYILESSGPASRGPRFCLVIEGIMHAMEKTQGTEITKIIKQRQDTNQEKTQPKKTRVTCRRRTRGQDFGAPGHHFEVILLSF